MITNKLLRGCGERKDKSLYICVAQNRMGQPLEYFVVDPPIPYIGEPFRSPMIIYDKARKVYDVLMWVGKEYYPNPWDLLEEARLYGVSKRVPYSFDFSKISPFRSRLILIHPNVIFGFYYKANLTHHSHEWNELDKYKSCTFALKQMGVFQYVNEKHEVKYYNDGAVIKTPSVEYRVKYPIKPKGRFKNGVLVPDVKMEFHPGIFAQFYITHMDFVSKDGNMPIDLYNRKKNSKINIRVIKE